jgi:hypothetical protein
MTIPSSNIKISDINIELSSPFASDIRLYNDIYAVSNASRQQYSGSYHNLTMTPTASVNFANAIAGPYLAGTPSANIKLSSWAAYRHAANVRLNIQMNQNSPVYTVNYEIYLSSNAGMYQYNILSGSLTSNPGSWVNLSNWDSGVDAYNSFGTANYEYFIEAIFYAIPSSGPPLNLNIYSYNDTDAVGPDQTRDSYTNVNGIQDIISPPWNGSFQATIVSDGNTSWPAPGIGWNKRTSYILDFS